jgi:E3 ubiquitin-protein ligase HERC1
MLNLRVITHKYVLCLDYLILFIGNLYHGGENQTRTLPQFTQDDSITCILDTDARTLSFAKNEENPLVAFEDIPNDIELYPVVTFYSSSPGERVRISSMIMQGVQKDLGELKF